MVDQYWKEAEAIKEDLIRWRRHLHQIPELGLRLPETSSYIQGELDKLGISYTVSK